jgi:hypothetical protein
MPDIKRIRWLEDLLKTEGYHYHPLIKFAGIFLVDKLKQKNVFGVFAGYRDYEREHKRYPYCDGIYISDEMTEGNPLHQICTAAHEVGHFKLQTSGPEIGNSEGYAETYTIVFLYEFFSPELAKEICRIHRYGEDPCLVKGVRERATVLIKGTIRQKIVGSRILKYLGRKRPKTKARFDTSVGISERIESLQKRLGRIGR